MIGGAPIADSPIGDAGGSVVYLPVSPISTAGDASRSVMPVDLGVNLLWDTGDEMVWDDDSNIGWERS